MKEKQELLMTPGPVEFSPAVLAAMARPTDNHVGPDFIECFGQVLESVKVVFQAPSYQPFILAGSGTFAMDVALSNLLEMGDNVLIVYSGYFSERMAEMASYYGAEADVIEAGIGDVPDVALVKEALQRKDYKIVCITHVDTSTSVLADIQGISKVAKDAGALVVVDGVAAAGGADCKTEEWGIDVYLTASQKALGVPPGLALLAVSEAALHCSGGRRHPVTNYYGSFVKWLPIMQAYQARKPAYFGTPAVNLVYALAVSLKEILAEGLENRFERHLRQGEAFRAGIKSMGLKLIAQTEEVAAPTLTAIYYPEGLDGRLVSELSREGVLVAGGILPGLKEKYFRVGHMGYASMLDLLGAMGGIERALYTCGYRGFTHGDGLTACQKTCLVRI